MILECAENPGVYRVHSETLTAEDILDAALCIMNNRYAKGAAFTNPDAAKSFFRHALGAKDREVFAVAFFDTQHRLIKFEEMFSGTLDSAAVYPREIIRRAMLLNAGAIMIGHNHPSGDPTPSCADNELTKRIIRACDTMGLTVLDHLVVGKTVFSFKENGLCFN